MERWNPAWAALLEEAVTNPGRMLAAYTAFWSYSVGNILAATAQAMERNLPLGPIAPFQVWKQRGRHVRKGEKAIWLCMPVTVRGRSTDSRVDGGHQQGDGHVHQHVVDHHVDDGDDHVAGRTVFVWKPHWFLLSQTEGAAYTPPPIPGWDKASALASLDIHEVPYDSLEGNVQGFADGRTFALNPLAELPHKTLFHECAHILLGHTTDTVHDGGTRREREAEAEAVALLCCASLGLPGEAECRGYLQHWWGVHELTEPMARRICTTADKLLKAGVPHGRP